MRRWITAIFALHFLVSVGLFASGQIDTTPSSPSAPLASLLPESGPGHDHDLLGTSVDHGLTDSHPELPELLQLDIIALPTPHALAVPVSHVAGATPQPVLDGPKRPPRAFAA